MKKKKRARCALFLCFLFFLLFLFIFPLSLATHVRAAACRPVQVSGLKLVKMFRGDFGSAYNICSMILKVNIFLFITLLGLVSHAF